MRHYQDSVVNQNGVPVQSVTVTVRAAATPAGSGALSTLYSDNGVTSLANPLTGDVRGNFDFFVANGRYDITFSGGSPAITSYTQADIEIADLTEEIQDAADFPGADAGAKIANAIGTLPSTGGTVDARGLQGAQTISSDIFSGVTKPGMLLVGASTFTVTATQNIPSNWTILGIGYTQSVFLDGITGAAANPMFKVTNADQIILEKIKLQGTANTGNLLSIINTSGSHGNHLIQDCTFLSTSGTGKDQAGLSMTSAGIYVYNVSSDLRIHHNIINSNGRGIVFDAAGTGTENACEIFSNKLSSNVSDAIQQIGGATLGTSIIGNHIELNGGFGISMVAFGGAHISGNYFEANTLGHIRATGTAASGVKVSANLFATNSITDGAAITWTSSGSKSQGVSIDSNYFNLPQAAILSKLVSVDFNDSSITNNTVIVAAGGTVTDAFRLETGSLQVSTYGNKKSLAGAGTITNFINDIPKGVIADGASPYFQGQNLLLSGSDNGLWQQSTNGNIVANAVGTGYVGLNLGTPFGTAGSGGVVWGNGTTTQKGILRSNGNVAMVGNLSIIANSIPTPTTYLALTGSPTGARVWTLQDASDTVVGRATTDTLTNKTLGDFLKVNASGTSIKQIRLFTAVAVDPGSIAATTRGSIAVTIAGTPGIATGDVIIPVQGINGINDDLVFEGVTATGANQVTWFFYNPTAGPIDDASVNWDILWIDVT